MPVTLEQVGSAVVVTLNYPAARNALGPNEAAELADAVEEAAVRRASALVLTGEGAFCSGGDLRSFAELSEAYTPQGVRKRVYGNVQRIFRGLRTAAMPTISAVDGPAIGLGMDLALACDMRFVGPNGWMQQGWARLGLIPAGGGAWFLEQTAPGLMWELLADQRRLSAAQCQDLGLGVAVEPTARDAALDRAEFLDGMDIESRSAYAELSRRARWPEDSYLDLCADYQSGFIGSARFRDATAQVLRPREASAS